MTPSEPERPKSVEGHNEETRTERLLEALLHSAEEMDQNALLIRFAIVRSTEDEINKSASYEAVAQIETTEQQLATVNDRVRPALRRGVKPDTRMVVDSNPANATTPALLDLAQRWITTHLPAAEIEEISMLASVVIGDRRKATAWLSEPNIAMDDRSPIDLIGEEDGFERVKRLLLRIEYGVLA